MKSSSEWLDTSLARSEDRPNPFSLRAVCLVALFPLLLASPAYAQNIVVEAYSSFVRTMAYSVTNNYQEMMNTNLETKQIEFNGQIVTYQYLLWRLRPNSVCNNYKHDLIAYSLCGRSAQQLFTQTCKHLNDNPSSHWKHAKLKNLYCAASVEYSPVIAEAGISKKQNDADLKQRQQCSVLRMEAMRTRDPRTIQLRDQACGGNQ